MTKTIDMFSNLLKVALRSIKRQKFFALIHLTGLAFGLTVCLIIALYSVYELGYDHFHTKADRIYRINQTFIWGDDNALFGSTGPAVVHALREEVPDFEALTRVFPVGSKIITRSDLSYPVVFEEENILAVDDNFLEIFTFPVIKGNQASALMDPNSVVITESMAKKYFPHEEALGKTLEIGEGTRRQSLKVAGIAKDLPANSHIQFDFLLSMNTFPSVADRRDSWMWTTFVTFGLLRPEADPEVVAHKVAGVPGKYLEAFLQKYRGISYKEFIESGEKWNLYMQPFLDIHLKSTNVYSRLNETGDIQDLYILWIIGGLVLGLSLINFINLSTAKSSSRAKEVGIRKVIGSSRSLLIYQFLTESFVYVVISVLLAYFLSELILPSFNEIANVHLDTTAFIHPVAIGAIILFIGLVGILGGIYPAFYLSSFRPARVLKGKVAQGSRGRNVRNILVTVQFTISIIMIACTLVVHDQVSYWINYDLGFDQKNKIIIENVNRLDQQAETFKNELLSNPKIQNASIVSDTPPLIWDFDNFKREADKSYNVSVNYLTADEELLSIFGFKLIHGRGIQKGFNDSTNMVVTEYFTRAFGFPTSESALGEYITYNDTRFKIIGIIEDFVTSLSSSNYPVAILDHSAPIFRNPQTKLVLDVKEAMSGNDLQVLLKELEASWQGFTNKSPFSYAFVDQEYQNLFTQTIKFGQLLTGFALMAIVIACLGLIGLVAFIVEKRNKEIGVRKVLGATILNIWMMLSSDFGKLLLISFTFAAPISWYAMSFWLENFELRTSISLVTIIGSGVLMVVIAIVTTSFQTIKAAKVNPVDYLKEE